MGCGRENDWEGSAHRTFWTTMKREMAAPRISLLGTVPRCFTYALEAEILSKETGCWWSHLLRWGCRRDNLVRHNYVKQQEHSCWKRLLSLFPFCSTLAGQSLSSGSLFPCLPPSLPFTPSRWSSSMVYADCSVMDSISSSADWLVLFGEGWVISCVHLLVTSGLIPGRGLLG